MPFPIYIKDEYVVLRHKSSQMIIVGQMAEDFKNQLGASSIFSLSWIEGFPVESGEFNANIWEFIGERSFPRKDENFWAFFIVIRDLVKEVNRA